MFNNGDLFLIYKGSGGLSHNLSGLNLAINACESQKRKLIIDMKIHSAFKINFSEIFVINGLNIEYYDSYDCIDLNTPYKNKTVKAISNSGCKYENGSYYLFDEDISKPYINESEKIVAYCGVGRENKNKYNIQINERIIKMLFEEEAINEQYISIHFRNTDIQNNIDLFLKKYEEIKSITNINTLYISSDFNETYDIFLNKFPSVKIIRKTIPEKGIKNLHYSKCDKFKEIYECIRDIYYISKSTYFIPSYNSGLSRLIIEQIKNIYPIIPNLTSNTIVVSKF